VINTLSGNYKSIKKKGEFMGWASGVEIFDVVAGALLDDKKEINKKKVLKSLINVLEDGDWDTQNDSDYYDHPLVQEIFKELHPNWFEDED